MALPHSIRSLTVTVLYGGSERRVERTPLRSRLTDGPDLCMLAVERIALRQGVE
jgi:hypothetical protein